MKEVTRYIAADGREFDSRNDCLAHERDNALHLLLAGKTADEMLAALTRQDVALADALEAAGDRIKAARLDAGELKRRRRRTEGETASEPAGESAGPAESAGAAEPVVQSEAA